MVELIKTMKKHWWIIVSYLIGTSIIAMFLISIIYKTNLQLEIINGWISLILGFVATLVSIIGTILSFYNLDQTNESERRINLILCDLKNEVEKTREFQENTMGRQMKVKEVPPEKKIIIEEN